MPNDIPVLIVGAGPTGLAMAVELKRHKIPFRIIDKKPKQTTTSNALGIQPRTLEIWDDQNLILKALDSGYPLTGLNLHSATKILARLDTYRLATIYPYILSLPQAQTESLLSAHLEEQGVNIEFNTELIQVTERTEFTCAVVRQPNGEEIQIKTSWLIACDGGHSTVREQLHIPFEGQEQLQHFMMADISFTTASAKDRAEIFLHPKGALLMLPLSPTDARIIFDVTNNSDYAQVQHPSDDQIRNALVERSSIKSDLKTVNWRSGFHVQEKLIPQYKHNMVFFAGDAAHVHSPAGAQGLNTGIQDSYNLAWKLAAVINNQASPQILDSYHNERYPVAKRVVMTSSMLTRGITLKNPFTITLRNLVIKILCKQKKLANKFIDLMSELSINYMSSTLTKEAEPSAPGPKAGERFLDCYIDAKNTDRLLNYIRGTAISILVFSGVLRDQRLEQIEEILIKLNRKFGSGIKYFLVVVTPFQKQNECFQIINDFEQFAHRKYQITTPLFYVIRPDKYISFRGSLKDQEALEEHLAKFVGV